MPETSSAAVNREAADDTPATVEPPPRRAPMLPEIDLPGSTAAPGQAVQPQAAPTGPAASEAPPRPQNDPLAPLKSLSEAELIALFS